MQEKNENKPGPYYLGVEGDGTRTIAIITNAEGHQVAYGEAGTANHNFIGVAEAIDNIFAAVDSAIAQIDCQLPLEKAWLGIAGIDCASNYDAYYPRLALLARTVRLTNDAELPLSALDNATGVSLVVGVGTITLARDRRGKTRRVSGWGYFLGDEGSAYDIGHQALQAVVRAADGRSEGTLLRDMILSHWRLNKTSDILAQVYPQADRSKIAEIAGVVFKAIREGDRVATKIGQRAAEELAFSIAVASAGLDYSLAGVPVALSGPLLVKEPAFCMQILEKARRNRALGQVVTVEDGAYSAARAARSIDHEQGWLRGIELDKADSNRSLVV